MILTFEASHFIHCFIDEFDDVELVKGYGSIGEVRGNAFDECWRHVEAGFLDGFGIALVGLEIFRKGGHSGGILARSGKQHLALLHVDEEGHVIVASSGSGFIQADLSDQGVVGFAARQIHVMIDDSPKQCVMLTDQAGDRRNGHHFDQLHDKRFKQQSESAVRSGPRHGDPMNAATSTVDARSPGMEKGLMLEEVQVAPSQAFGIVSLASRGALRTRERGATREVEMDIESTRFHAEATLIYHPRSCQT